MYEAFYKLAEDPFRLTPDPRFAFAHASYAKARAYLQYGLFRGEGFVAITGQPGSGKTTLIEELLADVSEAVQVTQLIASELEADDLLRMVAYALGLAETHQSKATVLHEIRERLVAMREGGRRSVLIVDEAQGLNSHALEELRLLTNVTDRQGPLLQIILVGQEQLRELLKRPELEQLKGRMIAAYHLRPMEAEETRDYIIHRLRTAGWTGDPDLSGIVVRIIHHAAGGNARRVNLICSRLLLHGYVSNKHYLAVPDIRQVLEEMQDEELASWEELLRELTQAVEAEGRQDQPRLTVAAGEQGVAVHGCGQRDGGAASAQHSATMQRTESEPASRPDSPARPTGRQAGSEGAGERVGQKGTAERRHSTASAGAGNSARGAGAARQTGRKRDSPPSTTPRPDRRGSGETGESPPDFHADAGERLLEPESPAQDPSSVAPRGRARAWQLTIGMAVVLLIAALAVALHDPAREWASRMVQTWIQEVAAPPEGRDGDAAEPGQP